MSKKTPKATGDTGGDTRGEATLADAERLVERLARHADLSLVEPLKPLDISRLRKPPSSYAPIIDDAARQLARDAQRLHLASVTSDDLLRAHQQRELLLSSENAFKRLHRNAYEQRLALDDDVMGKLLLIERRVSAMAEEDPGLADAWRFLTDYLGDFRRKGPAPASNGDTPPGDGTADGAADGAPAAP